MTSKSYWPGLPRPLGPRNLGKVKLHQAFRLGLWLALAVTPAAWPAELAPEKLYQKVLPSVMTLDVESQSGEKFLGSAVLVLADDAVLTAWHVVADARSVWANFADGQRVKVIGCIDQDVVRDLALLKLEKKMPNRQARVSREVPSVAARAYVIGAPKGYDFSISDGLISQIRSVDGFPQYQLSCPISPGNSGGPVLNTRGEVIGIASWTKSDAQNVSFAIPAQEFNRLKVSQRPVSWEQVAVREHSAPPKRRVTSRLTTDTVLKPEAGAGNFAGFQKWMESSVGKSVTVVTQESGRTNVFSFTVK